MSYEKYQHKLQQLGSDIMLLADPNSGVDHVIWFGTEPLPTTGLAGHLRQALLDSGIPYYFIEYVPD
jgi:hypothetical protein